jgi:hypothetical protein
MNRPIKQNNLLDHPERSPHNPTPLIKKNTRSND